MHTCTLAGGFFSVPQMACRGSQNFEELKLFGGPRHPALQSQQWQFSRYVTEEAGGREGKEQLKPRTPHEGRGELNKKDPPPCACTERMWVQATIL